MEGRMKRSDVLTFMSDFGWNGGYVAACEAVIARVRPEARVSHISHEVGLGEVAAGATILARVAPLYPPAVHLAVIDPGVGTDRRPIAIVADRGDVLVGPDNGLLVPATEALGGLREAWLLDPRQVRTEADLPPAAVSSTFHGRDVFAPAAALFSRNTDPALCGASVDPSGLVRLTPPVWQVFAEGATTEVIEIDRFGNVGLALPFEDFLPRRGAFTVEIEGEGLSEWTACMVRTYAELRPGELGLLRDSWGQVALALNGASAAELLSVQRGMTVRLASSATGV
jgi:S-adenosyl-L-methionine hydrolase (adenosine-forming)